MLPQLPAARGARTLGPSEGHSTRAGYACSMFCLGPCGYFVVCFCLVNLDRLQFLRSRLCHTQIWSRFSLRLRLAFSSTCGWGRISDAGGMELYPHSHSPRPWEAQEKLTIPSWMGQCPCGKARMLSKHSTGKTSQEFGSDLVRIRKCGMSDPRGALGKSHC